MENETSSKEATWFSDLSWKTAALSAVLALVVGGGSGAGVVASKAVAAQGITQSEADNRYLTIEAADRRSAKRDEQTDRIERKLDELGQKLDERYVRKETFDERTGNLKELMLQIIDNQKNLK